MARLMRLRGLRRGSSLVESALVLPLLTVLVFAGFEFGTILHLRQSMLHAARESARVLAIQGGTMTEAEAVAWDLLPNNDLPYEVELTRPAVDSEDRTVTATISLPVGDGSVGVATSAMFSATTLRVSVSMRSEQ